MSDTPRTDALLDPAGTENDIKALCAKYNRLLEHARTLEREACRPEELAIELLRELRTKHFTDYEGSTPFTWGYREDTSLRDVDMPLAEKIDALLRDTPSPQLLSTEKP